MKALWNGEVIAESDDTVIIEGNHYFPANSLRSEFFSESPKRSMCPWKGTASYYDVEVSGLRNEGAAWYYPTPKPAAEAITDHVAFWQGVEVGE